MIGVLALSLIPLVRGDCEGVFEFVGIPLSEEVIVVGVLTLSLISLVRGDCGGVFEFVDIPLSVEMIVVGVWFCALPLY